MREGFGGRERSQRLVKSFPYVHHTKSLCVAAEGEAANEAEVNFISPPNSRHTKFHSQISANVSVYHRSLFLRFRENEGMVRNSDG